MMKYCKFQVNFKDENDDDFDQNTSVIDKALKLLPDLLVEKTELLYKFYEVKHDNHQSFQRNIFDNVYFYSLGRQ